MPKVSLARRSETSLAGMSLTDTFLSANILWRTSSIHFWRTSSSAPPSGRDLTAMLRTSSL